MLLLSILDLYKLRRQQWLETKELEEIQRKKLKAMINHAYRKVRYYRRLFDSARIRPEDIKTVDDLTRIPITRRQDLQQLPREDIVAKDVDLNLCKRLLTSGSSGKPLLVHLSKNDDDFYGMVWARTFLENGRKLWDRSADFKFHFPPKYWFERLGIWRKTIISVLDDPIKKIETLRQVKPDVIRGNPFELVNLARIVQQLGVDGISPRLVFTMGSLLDEQSRALIESALHTRVLDSYGAAELGCIAWECSAHRGYHINIDTVVVEFTNDDGEPVGKGERGKIVCTGLHSSAMPFIRYDLGDVGIASDEKCPCGRGLPLLKGLEGRADDFLVSADGTLHSPSVIVNQIKLIVGIRQFRIIQDSERKVTAQVVPDKGMSLETIEKIKYVMKKIMGDELDIRVEIVDAIPPDASGKIRSLISKVKKEFR